MLHALVLPDSIAGRVEARPPTFACSSSYAGEDTAWVHVSGELDIVTKPRLARVLRETQMEAPVVVLDLRDLTFMDSSGVHIIVDATIRARLSGHRLVVLRGAPTVDRMFALTGSFGEIDFGDDDVPEPPLRLLRLAEDDRP
jgi:anti-sigma B factor antagonist